MKLYLSSFKLGNNKAKLVECSPKRKIGYIPNALNYPKMDDSRLEKLVEGDMSSLSDLGLDCELIDLKDYFGKKDVLDKKIKEVGAVFVSGGNVFILRQAMMLSGLDDILINLINDEGFLYAGYSAAGCILSKSLKGYDIVDSPNDFPYKELTKTIWEGLGVIDFMFLPHFDSDHPESANIQKEVDYCRKNNLPYKTLRDGDVILMDV